MIHHDIKKLGETLELNNKQIEELTNDINELINSSGNIPIWNATLFCRLLSGIDPYYLELIVSSDNGVHSIDAFKPYDNFEDYTTAINKEKES